MAFSETMVQLESLLSSAMKDLQKVARGNKAASQRVRVSTVKLEKIGKRFRKESLSLEKKRSLTKKAPKKRKKR